MVPEADSRHVHEVGGSPTAVVTSAPVHKKRHLALYKERYLHLDIPQEMTWADCTERALFAIYQARRLEPLLGASAGSSSVFLKLSWMKELLEVPAPRLQDWSGLPNLS